MDVPSPAMYAELVRLLRAAFEDCMIALDEVGCPEVAERLRERWPETKVPE